MAITKSVGSILEGMGSGVTSRSAKAPTNTSPGAATTITLTPNLPINTGYVRVQLKGYTAGGGFVGMTIKGSDGTNTWDLGFVAPAAAQAALDYVSIMLQFIADNALTTITVVFTVSTAPSGDTPQLDAEVWGALM